MEDNFIDSTKYDLLVELGEEDKSLALENKQTQAPAYVPKGIIRVYQDHIPWNNRSNATLLSLGKVLNVDYFIHPVEALERGIPIGTKVVLIASNSYGDPIPVSSENSRLVRRNLEWFVRLGGILIVDMADNLEIGGYFAPCSYGTPDYIFPDDNEAQSLYLTPQAYHTSFVNGPTITLTNENIKMADGYRWSAHGNLVDGIVIPKQSRVLVTAVFNGVKKPVLAEYRIGCGLIIVDTITKEFSGHNPVGNGPSNILTNLFYYAFRQRRYI